MVKKIMVVDDDPNTIKFLEVRLQSWGYKTSSVCDGLDCLLKVTVEHPDLILLDINMPGLDGFCVCSEITTSYDIPVIIITGDNDDITRENACVFGAFEFVGKPFNIRELKHKIQRALTYKDV